MKTNFLPLPLLALAALLCAPAFGQAQSILLSAGNFTILGGTAITSTGTTGTNVVNGNIGLFPTATTGITGFPPAIITNGAIIATGPVTDQAQQDLLKAIVGLDGMPSNVNMSNVDMGGTTLFKGVYTFDGAASLNGAVTLDAQGLNGAYWVFQIASTLTTSLGSNVSLINPGSNGGSDDGIFWVTGTGMTIGANSHIMGNYLAGTSITFDGQTSGEGRALARAAVSLDVNVVDALGGPNGSDWTGGLTYSQSGSVVPVPEPAAILWLAPLAAIGFALWRRHSVVSKIVS